MMQRTTHSNENHGMNDTFLSQLEPCVSSFEHSPVMLVEFTTKFLRWVHLSNHSSESILTCVMGTLEHLLTFPKFGPGHETRGGARGQNLGHLKIVLNCFSGNPF